MCPTFYICKNQTNFKTPINPLKKEYFHEKWLLSLHPRVKNDQIFIEFDFGLIFSLLCQIKQSSYVKGGTHPFNLLCTYIESEWMSSVQARDE